MQQEQLYPGYDFTLKSPGRRFYNDLEIKRFCFDKWQEGYTQSEISKMVGLDRSTVAYHIKKYDKNKY